VILIHQRHRRTDRQTDGRHAISIPRYALVHRAVKRQGKDDHIKLKFGKTTQRGAAFLRKVKGQGRQITRYIRYRHEIG